MASGGADTLYNLRERGESYDDVLRRILAGWGEYVESKTKKHLCGVECYFLTFIL